jgi:hypothetical protein
MEQKRIESELAARRKAGSVVKRLGGLKGVTAILTGRGVPPELRALVEEGFTNNAIARFSLVHQRRGAIGKILAKLSGADWNALVDTLVPHVASSARSTLEALANRPYQQNLTRKPFRAPHARETLADVRGRWLVNTTLLIGEYDVDIRWIAAWAAHLGGWSGGTDLGWLLAGAIDAGDAVANDVYGILEASALGEHEVGVMGRHVTQAFMSSSRPDAWAFVERLLLSAQRQEGLRQAILESVDESHPEAFRRMLRLIREENLTRFSSVVRAADTWFGFLWDGSSVVKVDSIIDRVLLFLDNPNDRQAAFAESDAETVYLALWSAAFGNVEAAIEPAKGLLSSPSAEVRFVATHFLAQSFWSTPRAPLIEMLGDPDLRVAARALVNFGGEPSPSVDGTRLFEQLEQLIVRIPKRTKTLQPIVWPWTGRKLEKSEIASALAANASSVSGERLLPYVPDLQPMDRVAFIRRGAGLPSRWTIGFQPPTPRSLTPAERTIVLELLGDASANVRAAAFEAMRAAPLMADEVTRLVELLDRKPGDLRNGCLVRLRMLDDERLLAAADVLLGDDDESRRVAGLELLRDATEKNRAEAKVRARIEKYAAGRTNLTSEERTHVDAVLGERQAVATTEDGLGLVDRAAIRVWPAARVRQSLLDTAGARASLESLAALVLENSKTEIRTASGETKLLVESVPLSFGPRRRETSEAPLVIPLADTWRRWADSREKAQRDDDGMELVRALMTGRGSRVWQSDAAKEVVGLGRWSSGERFLRGLVEWCIVWNPPADVTAFLLDGFENALAAFTEKDYAEILEAAVKAQQVVFGVGGLVRPAHQEKLARAEQWLRRLRWWRDLFPSFFAASDHERLYGLLRAFETRARGHGMLRAGVDEFVAVYHAGIVGEAELLDLLAGPFSVQRGTSLLRLLSTKKPARAVADHLELLGIIDKCRRRIVEVETQRGDRSTAASRLAMELRWTGGLDTVSRALNALGTSHFARSFSWFGSGDSRQETLSHLVVRSVPRDEDTLDAFAQWARSARVRESRLVELAVYAPQWAAHVNHVVEWPGLESAVWWLEAHTKDDRTWRLQEMKELWAAEVSERTPLSATDLTEGAVDVEWFRAVYRELGAERWTALDKAAKYAASSTGHTRAQLFARAMAGLVTRDELLKRIDSRHQDSVRALGLLPLADGEARADDVLTRYTRLQEFRREARKFGSQRQQSEKRAVAIGLENLARTAGFRDPQRLQWAMEQHAVADLVQGPVTLDKGDARFELSLDADGVASLRVTKNGKTLKAVPAALKKDAGVAELKDRVQELKRQRSRVCDALEEAMIRGDRFRSSELRALVSNPILAPALSRVVFAGDDIAGYLDEEGRVLRDHAGAKHALGSDEDVRIAHPHDLFTGGQWSAWQHECFHAKRVQPFKQLFRELYPMTDVERGAERTRRYAGHQVNPRQALALLGGRGWVARPEEGVSRTFHESGLTVRLGFEEPFFTPAEVEGLTLDEVMFTKKGGVTPIALREIPSRLFSEAMRDLDLVVSVAHQGGVDPEATASTVEMRAALVAETCALLGLGNVELESHHAIIRGTLGTYSIHLGSAGVVLMPGTALPIAAVHSQHRGRIFLPFADDDPRTAEVLSKVLLLARDKEIRDPNILEWIRATNRGSVALSPPEGL